MSKSVPDISFLGVCEDIRYIPASPSTLPEMSLIGLKSVVASHIFPLSMNDSFFIFGAFAADEQESTKIVVTDENGQDVFWIDLSMGVTRSSVQDATSDEKTQDTSAQANSVAPQVPAAIWAPANTRNKSWTIIPFRPGTSIVPLLIYRPGTYYIVGRRGEDEFPMGFLVFVEVKTPPLTPDRVAAIRAKPHAAKRVHVQLSCRNCDESIHAYAGIEKDDALELEGWQWYESLPDEFTCSCGETSNIDLTYIRSNLHGLLGDTLRTGPRVSLTHMHDPDSLERIFNDFSGLLEEQPAEEELQQFIEDNPVLLHTFSPDRVFYKKPILAKHQTDFAVVSSSKELVLIEIEKSSIRLLRKDGGVTAASTHAFDQVRDWLHEADEHRPAVLEAFDLSPDEVTQVRGAVICGRDQGYDAEALRKLKATRYERIVFLTYDDLLRSLGILIRSLVEMRAPQPF